MVLKVNTEHPLYEAVANNELEKIQVCLVEFGHSMTRNNKGESLLSVAIQNENLAIVQLLLEHNVETSAFDFNGNTPLMLACQIGFHDAIKCLIEAGTEVNMQNAFGKTALMYAAIALDAESVSLLLQSDADACLIDKSGNSAFTHFKQHQGALLNDLSAKREIRQLLAPSALAAKPRKDSNNARSFLQLIGSEKVPSRVLDGLLVIILLSGILYFLTLPIDFKKPPLIFLLLIVYAFVSVKFFKHTWIVYRYTSEQDESEIKVDLSEANNSSSLVFLASIFNFGFKNLQLSCLNIDTTALQQQAKSILWLAGLAFGLLFIGYGLSWLETDPLINHLLCTLSMLIFSVAVILERFRRRHALIATYKMLDEEAESFMRNTLSTPDTSEEKVSTALYLRAFETTGKLFVRNIDLELALSRFLSPLMLVITFGVPGEYQGAARVLSSEEQWQDKVLALMHTSDVILMIPSERPGTVWEAEKLKQKGLLDKTIFIMPPDIDYMDGKFSDTWNRAAEAFASILLQLPLHANRGLIFQLNEQGYLKSFAPLDEMDSFIHSLDSDLSSRESFESRGDTEIDQRDDFRSDGFDDY